MNPPSSKSSSRLAAVIRCRALVFLPILTVLLVILPGSQALAKKHYKMKNVSIEADLESDGTMLVSESRTYYFSGSYRYAFRTFPLDAAINYSDFAVWENNQAYLLSNNEEPGTFQVNTDDKEIEVRWYYRASNEDRTFTISYGVKNAVNRYLDGAVLYYKFIGDGFKKSTEALTIKVNPPTSIEKWKVRQWAHGPLWGSSQTSSQGVVTASCLELPSKQYFELRILYPKEMFTDAVLQERFVVDGIIAEETAWTEKSNLERTKDLENRAAVQERMKTGSWAMPLLLVLAVGWFTTIVRKYGHRPTIPSIPSSSGEVPSNLPPAIVGYLIAEREVSGPAIMGTMLDLARRGFMEFKEEMELKKGFMGKEKWEPAHLWVLKKDYYQQHKNDLALFEEMLVQFVFEDLVEGSGEIENETVVPMEAFKKNQSKVQKFFGKWSKEVKAEGEKCNFYDQESFKGRNKGLILGGALLFLTVPMAFLFHEWAFIPGVGGLIILLSALGIVHHNMEGRIQEKRWKSLKKYLTSQEFKKSDPTSVLNSVEPYLVYGVVLGMQKKHLASLGEIIPVGKQAHIIPWYLHQTGVGGFSGESFGSSFSAAVVSANTAMSSSAGAGGGASGGGGGGAGGGGGGAG